MRDDCAEEEALGPGRGFIVDGDTIVGIGRVAAVRELLGDALGDEAARMPHALGKRIDGKVQSKLAFAAARARLLAHQTLVRRAAPFEGACHVAGAAAQTGIGWIGILD